MAVSFNKGTVKKPKNVDPQKVPQGIDASTYFAPLIADEIKLSMTLFHTYPQETIKSLIMKMFQYLVVPDDFSVDRDEFGPDAKIDELNLLMSSIYIIIRTAVRNKIKISVVKNDLTEMNLPKQYVDDVTQGISKLRLKIESATVQDRIHFPKLEKLKWRIDVVISSGVLSRVLRPNILMQMVLQDGSIRTFEVSVEQFNQLRYNVAKVLNDMQTLERHPIIKIVNEFKKREEDDYNH